jgi:two-component system sensor histidine kinase and response regulator WspE
VSPPAEDLSGFSLHDLFRAEVETHAATLEHGLVELESAPTDPRALEALMRAAHSIKGAARIVGLARAVDLAHAMEDLLVAAQRGAVTLGAEAVDALLAGTDLLRRLGTLAEGEGQRFFDQNEATLEPLIATFGALRTGASPTPVARPAPRAPAPPPSAPEAAPPPQAAASPPAAPAPVPAPPSAPPPAAAGRTPGDPSRAAVRVDAEGLTRMLSFAGESVVQARRLGDQADQLGRLRGAMERLDIEVERLLAEGDRPQGLDVVARHLQEARDALDRRADALEQAARQAADLAERLYRQVLRSRLRPFSEGASAYPRMVRDLARELGRQVRFEIEGRDVPVDRDILERLDAPLQHMLRNALDHGLETPEERRAAGKDPTGRLLLRARHHAGMLEVRVEDDGRGMDPDALRAKIVERGLIPAQIAADLGEAELLEFLFLPGFSTARRVTQISGRGVGLDVVHSMVRDAGGVVRAERVATGGLRFVLVLPVTRSVIRVALAEVAGEPYAFPLTQIERLLAVPVAQVRAAEDRQHVDYDGRVVGLVPATDALGIKRPARAQDPGRVLILRSGEDLYGLVVDAFLGEQSLVVRPLDPRLGRVATVSALSLDAEGRPLVIVDVPDLLRSVDRLLHEGRLRSIRATGVAAAVRARRVKRILVVDDSITVREVERKLLQNRGYEVEVCVDGADGWNAVRSGRYDLVLTDVDMPRMDGIELVRRIRSEPRLERLPVMIVSYKDREEDRLRGLEAGANAYLTKSSFQDETLVRQVVDLVGEPTEGEADA